MTPRKDESNKARIWIFHRFAASLIVGLFLSNCGVSTGSELRDGPVASKVVRLPIKDPAATFVLNGPPHLDLDNDGQPSLGDNHVNVAVHFSAPEDRGGLEIPSSHIANFNGLSDLVQKITTLNATIPPSTGPIDVVIYAHAREGAMETGEVVKRNIFFHKYIEVEGVDLDHAELLAQALEPLFEGRSKKSRLFLVGCNVFGEPGNPASIQVGLAFGGKISRALGGIAVFGSQGKTGLAGSELTVQAEGSIAVPARSGLAD